MRSVQACGWRFGERGPSPQRVLLSFFQGTLRFNCQIEVTQWDHISLSWCIFASLLLSLKPLPWSIREAQCYFQDRLLKQKGLQWHFSYITGWVDLSLCEVSQTCSYHNSQCQLMLESLHRFSYFVEKTLICSLIASLNSHSSDVQIFCVNALWLPAVGLILWRTLRARCTKPFAWVPDAIRHIMYKLAHAS